VHPITADPPAQDHPLLQVVSSLYARFIPDGMATNAQIFAMLQLNVALHYGARASLGPVLGALTIMCHECLEASGACCSA